VLASLPCTPSLQAFAAVVEGKLAAWQLRHRTAFKIDRIAGNAEDRKMHHETASDAGKKVP